jgi:hypothetical protein
VVGVVGGPGQGQVFTFLTGGAAAPGQDGQPVEFMLAAPCAGRGFMRAAVQVPFQPGSAQVDQAGYPVRIRQRVTQREIGTGRMAPTIQRG